MTARRVTGLSLLLLGALLVASLPLSVGLLDYNATKRDEIASFLGYVNDHRTAYGARMALLFTKDAIVSVVVGAGLFLSFARVNRGLALAGAAGILVSTAAFLTIDAMEAVLLPLSKDAAGGGDVSSTLTVARAIALTSNVTGHLAFGSFAVGIMSFGLLFLRHQGEGVPPKWIGWLSLVAGTLWVLAWTGLLVEAGENFIPLGAICTLVWMFSLGTWLVRNASNQL